MIADPLPRMVDISATELMELGLVVAVFSLVKSPRFYEKGTWQLLGRGSCAFLLRAAEMGGRDRKKTDLLPVAAMMDVCDYTHATLHYKL